MTKDLSQTDDQRIYRSAVCLMKWMAGRVRERF
jgi:hypothetical protein